MVPLPTFAERQVADALRDQTPVQGLPGVSIKDVKLNPSAFDISFELRSGKNRVQVLGEIKQTFSPRIISEIAPWVRRLKNLRPDVAVALIAPALSEQSQTFCLENGIDFLDLAGNISINIPGKFTLRRAGLRARARASDPTESSPQTSNVFSGRYSRVLRVLLEKPKLWTLTEIGKELDEQTRRLTNALPASREVSFSISPGTISKALASLEEQLLIRRRGTAVVLPEPKRVLFQWAEKYKERYRWRLRSSFQTANPFGKDLAKMKAGIQPLISGFYAFTAAAAASATAPFIDVDVVDIFLLPTKSDSSLRKLKSAEDELPPLRFITPYDAGVFLYARQVRGIPVVSDIQAYLDLFSRGGRDLKQADYVLEKAIEPRWRTA
jgi:DNA-binding HxlR family transcriptional regulator